MTADLYRYDFDETTSTEDIESALLLAVWGCEALHGEAQTRLDAAHYFDPVKNACVVDARTPVGRDLNRLFAGFISREIGMDGFTIERIAKDAATQPWPALRTTNAASEKLDDESRPETERKQRTCLKCGKLFDSAGPGNRICRRCRRINDGLPTLTEAQLQTQRGAKRHNGELMNPDE